MSRRAATPAAAAPPSRLKPYTSSCSCSGSSMITFTALRTAAAGTMCETGRVEIDQVATIVDGLPHMRKLAGTRIYDHVLEHQLRRVLELGTYHGVSTCYLGAAVDEIDGHVTTIDRLSALDLEPNVNDLLERTGLTDRVTTIFAENSFTWELKRMLESADPPQFDFVFLDAGHTWDVTGFAFFLVDRLLSPGGWLLFDDLNWSITNSPSVSEAPWTMAMSQEERDSCQIEAVFDLLVARDERYDCRRQGNWGWAQKALDPADPTREPAQRVGATSAI
jgi:predicted O-methyltransferase YrrM